MDSGVFLDGSKDPQPRGIVKYGFSRDGAESKISAKPDPPEEEDLYRLHKSGRYGVDQMADQIGRPHLPPGDRHPRAIDTEQGDIDQFQDAKYDEQNPERHGKGGMKLVRSTVLHDTLLLF